MSGFFPSASIRDQVISIEPYSIGSVIWGYVETPTSAFPAGSEFDASDIRVVSLFTPNAPAGVTGDNPLIYSAGQDGITGTWRAMVAGTARLTSPQNRPIIPLQRIA